MSCQTGLLRHKTHSTAYHTTHVTPARGREIGVGQVEKATPVPDTNLETPKGWKFEQKKFEKWISISYLNFNEDSIHLFCLAWKIIQEELQCVCKDMAANDLNFVDTF